MGYLKKEREQWKQIVRQEQQTSHPHCLTDTTALKGQRKNKEKQKAKNNNT